MCKLLYYISKLPYNLCLGSTSLLCSKLELEMQCSCSFVCSKDARFLPLYLFISNFVLLMLLCVNIFTMDINCT